MKKKKKTAQSGTVITKNTIVSILVLAITVMNFLALAFALVDAKQEFKTEIERHFANGFTLVFGECPMAIESYSNLLVFFSVCHFAVAILMMTLLGIRIAVRRKLSFGKLGMTSVVISSIFTTLYFVLGCVAYSAATAYGGIGYGYDVNTFAFIPFALMIILVASFVLVKVKLPQGYRKVIEKKKK